MQGFSNSSSRREEEVIKLKNSCSSEEMAEFVEEEENIYDVCWALFYKYILLIIWVEQQKKMQPLIKRLR